MVAFLLDIVGASLVPHELPCDNATSDSAAVVIDTLARETTREDSDTTTTHEREAAVTHESVDQLSSPAPLSFFDYSYTDGTSLAATVLALLRSLYRLPQWTPLLNAVVQATLSSSSSVSSSNTSNDRRDDMNQPQHLHHATRSLACLSLLGGDTVRGRTCTTPSGPGDGYFIINKCSIQR